MSEITKKKLSTTLDRLPMGTSDADISTLRVNNKLPEGVRSKELYKDVIKIAWPSFVELMLTQLVSMADQMMVGSIGGSENTMAGIQALSAVGLTMQPKFLLMTAFMAMGTGITALVARYKGLGDKKSANLVIRQGLLFTFLAAIVLSILGYIFARPMVIFMGSTEEQVTLWSSQYLQIQMLGFLPLALTSTITASLRGVGDTKSSMVYNLIANLVNVVFNWLLIYGNLGFPELGVAGASIATVIGQFVAFVLATRIILKGNSFLKLQLREGFKPDRKMLGNILQIGIPAAIEQLVMRAGMIIFTKTVTSLGTIAYATHNVCMNIQSISFMTGQAFAVSATTLMGQSLGRKRHDMAQAYCSRTQRVGLAVSIVIGILFAFFGRNIVSMYNQDASIVTIGGNIMFFVAAMQPIQSIQFILAGGLRGAGDTKTTATITFITILIVRPVVAIALVKMTPLGLYGAWIALACDQCLRSLLISLRYRTGKWKLIKLKNEAVTKNA